MRFKTIAAAATVAALAAPAVAAAHVTLQPNKIPPGGFARFDVRVPNERDNAGTTKISVKMPPGILSASYEPQAGWSTEVKMRKLDEPAELHGEPVTEEVDTITWTGSGDRGVIGPGQFKDFGISVPVPEGKEGDQLKFAATQTYQGGEVVRWIGPEDADQPAPLVTFTAPAGEHGAATNGAAAENENASTTQSTAQTSGVTAEDVDDKASKGLAIGALIVGALGLIVGIAGFAAGRRKTA